MFDLASAVVSPENVRVSQKVLAPGVYSRFAFVTAGSNSDAERLIAHISRATVTGAPNAKARMSLTDTRKGGVREMPYLGPERNAPSPAKSLASELFISHLPPSPTKDDVLDLLTHGNVEARIISVAAAQGGAGIAYLKLASHESCSKAIRRLDGALVRDHAVCVEWSVPRGFLPPQNSPAPARRRSRSRRALLSSH